jgi:hypothetical protein
MARAVPETQTGLLELGFSPGVASDALTFGYPPKKRARKPFFDSCSCSFS